MIWRKRDYTTVVTAEECSNEIGAPGQTVTIRHMLRLFLLLIRHIEQTQRALVEANMRAAPDPDQVRRAEILERAHRLVAEWAPYTRSIKEMVTRMKSRGVSE